MRDASWSIVTTVHGIPETLLPCIAHHLQSDAQAIHVYLDAPNPVVEAALAPHPRVIVTLCDAAYWQSHQMPRPAGLVRRQITNLRDARSHSSSDWMVHIDADEFLVPARPHAAEADAALSLGRELAMVPDDIDWVRIRNMERLLPPADPRPQAEAGAETIFDGIFREQSPDAALIRQAYGPGAQYLLNGFAGYIRGKIGLRRGSLLVPRLHDVLTPDLARQRGQQKGAFAPKPSELPPFRVIENTRILHFDGWTALHWTCKLLRFVEMQNFNGHHQGRRNSVRFMADHPDPAERLALFDAVQRLSETGLAILSRHGLLRLTPFSAEALTRATFPDVALNFTSASFDARLRAADPDFFARHGGLMPEGAESWAKG